MATPETMDHPRTPPSRGSYDGPPCPFDVRVEPIARFLNCEIIDHPIYDGLELQSFDDPIHGTGMFAFLQRKADRRVDYYRQPGLTLDKTAYDIAGGIGEWIETPFEATRLEIAPDGVDVEVRFTDVGGRLVEVRIDDRDGRPRRRATLLAPVSDGIDHPTSLLLVHLHGFDLVRASGAAAPVIRIGGRAVSTGTLPGRRLHRRHLVKYAGPVSVVVLNRAYDGRLAVVNRGRRTGTPTLPPVGTGIAGLTDRYGEHHVRVVFDPAFPDVATLSDGEQLAGSWTIDIDGVMAVTGGTWAATRRSRQVRMELDVTRRWRPTRLPLLMRIVTRVVPTFRQWPTTYRWSASVDLGGEPTLSSRWERTSRGGDAYRRVTQPGDQSPLEQRASA